MFDACTMCDGTDPKCDLDGIVNDLVPVVHTARHVYSAIGVVIAILSFWKLKCSKVIYYYWLMRELLHIERPIQNGDNIYLLQPIIYVLYHISFSTNHIVPDSLMTVGALTATTYAWPKYAQGEMQPTQ